jgi:hypothetical protein
MLLQCYMIRTAGLPHGSSVCKTTQISGSVSELQAGRAHAGQVYATLNHCYQYGSS